jgi:hypothetical protein
MTDTAPAWARGFELAFLKEVAGVYREAFKPHSYGAFGVPKERDVADAHAAGELIWTRGPGNKVAAAAIFRFASRPQPHEDFAGRKATMQKGDLFIRSIAGAPEACERLLCSLAERAGRSRPTWVEAHVEIPETVALLERLGFERVMTKVSASSDLKGLFLRAHTNGHRRRPEPLEPADAPGVKVVRPDFLGLADVEAIFRELEAYQAGQPDEAFAQHYSSYNKRSSWSAFALQGFAYAEPDFIIKPAEMSIGWKAQHPARLAEPCGPTTAAPAFPETLALLARIPVEGFQRIRFMRLSGGGGELTRHADITDPEAGTADGKIARLHIPLRTSPACLFRSWALDGEEVRLHMPERSLSYIDTRKPHAVINPAEVERIHLVADAISGPALRELLAA